MRANNTSVMTAAEKEEEEGRGFAATPSADSDGLSVVLRDNSPTIRRRLPPPPAPPHLAV